MKAIIIGATGATGKSLVEQLLLDDKYTEIVTLVRRTSGNEHPKLKEYVVNFDHLKDDRDLIVGDVAFSCLGTTMKDAGSQAQQRKVDFDYQFQFAQLAVENQIPTFVLVSSMNANPKSKLFYPRIKGELEEAVLKLPYQHLHIFQPGFLDRPKSNRKGEIIGLKFIYFLNSMGLFNKFKPLKVHDLAKAMLQSVSTNMNRLTIYKMEDIHRLLNSNDF